ncbi:MAG: TonB-dependent receptor [Bacteroidia bacterium]|nr:TonB-dependent receptor [Bacteroidia bacterium]
MLLLLLQNIQAQTASFKGTVNDKETGAPIKNVLVHINNTNNHTHSDDKGDFFFVSILPGKYNLEFEKPGYESELIKVSISNSDTATLIVLMVSKTIALNAISISVDKPVSAASSSYLSRIDFINRPKNSAQDMLRLVPGLFIAQHAGGGKSEQIFIRGFDCDHGTDIATFVDGIPVNMPSHGHGQGYADLHFLIPEVVEGMNIFKGTSSPLYGDFATGAAVSFKTLDSLPQNLLQLETGYVPRNKTITSNRALALLKLPFNNSNVLSYFAVDVINNRGFFDRSQDFKRMNLFSKTTITINEYSRLNFSVTGFGSSWNASGQIPERGVNSGLITRFGSIDPNEGGTTQRNNYNLTYISKLGTGDFETQAYMCNYRFKLFSNFTFYLSDSINGDMIEQDDNRTVLGLNTKYTVAHTLFSLNNKLTIGTSFRSDDIENQLWHAPARVRLNANAHSLIHQRSNAVYVNEVFRFNNHFRAEIGLRYEYFIFDVEDLLPTTGSHQNYSGFNYQTALNPKLNLVYSINERTQLFFNTGSGFHSNDARSSVQDKTQHRLPLAVSTEIGALFRINRKTVISAALWDMELSNELVYVGDDGTTKNRGASRRVGIDISARSQFLSWLYFDVDVNFSESRFTDTIFGSQLKTNYYIPLAPVLTSAGGLTIKLKNAFECAVRYRFMKDRPGNETNTIIARGYNVIDMTANYKINNYKFGLVIENVLNVNWNEAQFATETRLKNEMSQVDELHFTPGTPFYVKVVIGYLF